MPTSAAQAHATGGDRRRRGLLLMLPLAGLLSSMASIASYPFGPNSWLFPGFFFGLFICCSLAVFTLLTTISRALALIIMTSVAYPISILLAGGIQLIRPGSHWSMGQQPSVSSIALFAGGFLGALLVIGATLSLVASETEKASLLNKSPLWSLSGGILAIIGWTLGPSLGMVLWSTAHSLHLTAPDETALNATGDTSHQFSLWFVWQVGMAVILGIMLRTSETSSPAKEAK
jgi:hypothetical protein